MPPPIASLGVKIYSPSLSLPVGSSSGCRLQRSRGGRGARRATEPLGRRSADPVRSLRKLFRPGCRSRPTERESVHQRARSLRHRLGPPVVWTVQDSAAIPGHPNSGLTVPGGRHEYPGLEQTWHPWRSAPRADTEPGRPSAPCVDRWRRQGAPDVPHRGMSGGACAAGIYRRPGQLPCGLKCLSTRRA
jgi:hypothetical protein